MSEKGINCLLRDLKNKLNRRGGFICDFICGKVCAKFSLL